MRRQARGKPYIEGAPEFNLSHTCGRTIAAFSLEAIGIDVESGSRRVHAGELATRFFDALRDGDIDALRQLLAADVAMVGDGGGKAPALAQTVTGVENVARVLAAAFPLLARIGAVVAPQDLTGQPGAIVRDRHGDVVGTMTLDVLDGRIQAVRSVANPDKLGHLGPVADAWAFARAVRQARRPGDTPVRSS